MPADVMIDCANGSDSRRSSTTYGFTLQTTRILQRSAICFQQLFFFLITPINSPWSFPALATAPFLVRNIFSSKKSRTCTKLREACNTESFWSSQQLLLSELSSLFASKVTTSQRSIGLCLSKVRRNSQIQIGIIYFFLRRHVLAKHRNGFPP